MTVTIKQSEKTVLGLDVSTMTGIVVLRGSTVVEAFEGDVSGVKDGNPLITRIKRMYALYDRIKDTVQRHHPALAAVEGYGYANAHTLALLVELGAVVRSCLYAKKVPMVEVPPMTLKKFVCGKGNAKKDQMRLSVFKRWGYEHESDNVIDAYGLARVGSALLGDSKVSMADQEALKKLRAAIYTHG